MDRQVNCCPGRTAVLSTALCLIALTSAGCRPDRETIHRQQFAAADADGDGFLNAVEFEASQPPDRAGDDSEKEFAKADENQDQRLEFEEYVETRPNYGRLLWFLGVFSAVSFVGSIIAIPIVVARLPVDHFVAPHAAADWVASSVARRLWLVLKNLLGILLITGGILMLILPGQGVLTILLGVAVMDLPGKWKLMRALARRPQVMKALNWMRERAEKPPLIPPPRKGDTHREFPQLPAR
jgi:hypothetical protein